MKKHIVHIKHGTAVTIAIAALIIILWPLYYELAAPGVKINKPFKIPDKPNFSKTPDFGLLTKNAFDTSQPLKSTEKVAFDSAGDQLAYKAAAGWLIALKTNTADPTKFIAQLKTAGYPAYLNNDKVLIGPYVDQLQAKAMQERIAHDLHISGEIISYDPLK